MPSFPAQDAFPPIAASVGDGGDNKESDVKAVQTVLVALSDGLMDARLHPGPVDGDCGVGTIGAIERLQRFHLHHRRPDGRIDAGGATEGRTRRLVAISEVAFQFPFTKSSRWKYAGPGAGMRAFGALRSKGRGHAGLDVYHTEGTPVLAMATGHVRRVAPFYLRTWAIEVEHPIAGFKDGCIVRYGEVDPDVDVSAGDQVEAGQRLGTVGVLTKANGRRLRVPSMMLHAEMYDGSGGDVPLSVKTWRSGVIGWNKRLTYRRKDLIDPTPHFLRAPLAS